MLAPGESVIGIRRRSIPLARRIVSVEAGPAVLVDATHTKTTSDTADHRALANRVIFRPGFPDGCLNMGEVLKKRRRGWMGLFG